MEEETPSQTYVPNCVASLIISHSTPSSITMIEPPTAPKPRVLYLGSLPILWQAPYT